MPILDIIQEPNKILRAKAEIVNPEKIQLGELKKLILDMSDTLYSIDVGVGLAAPQIGRNLQIFLVSEEAALTKRNQEKPDLEELKKSKASQKWKHLVFINPKIIKSSKKRNILPEGCLSVNDPKGRIIFGKVPRAEKITVEALDQNGKKIKIGAKGLFAQVIQHEFDHLNGVLFIDRAIEIRKISKEEVKEKQTKEKQP